MIHDPQSNKDLAGSFQMPAGPHLLVRTEMSARGFIEAHAGMGMVYVLHRPDGSPFYVGKAAGDQPQRPFAHVREALKGVVRTATKISAINEILAAGDEVLYSIDSFHRDGGEYSRETLLTHVLGLLRDGGPLTNTRDEFSHLGPGGPAGGFARIVYDFERASS